MSLRINNDLVLTTSFNKISFQVKINKQKFCIGETIHVEAEAENKGLEALTHHGSSSCDNTIYFSIESKDGNSFLVGEGSVHPILCTDDFREFHFDPNQKIKQSAAFKTKTVTIDDLINERPAEIGEYVLTAKYGEIWSTIPIQIQ